MDKHIFVCEDIIENIITGIYKAFVLCKKGYKPDDIGIIICSNSQYETEFFATYEAVTTDFDKVFKTMEHIKRKLGSDIHKDVLRAICHYDTERGYTLFRFLHYCFKCGKYASTDLTNKYVLRVMELSRKTWNETHLYYGFIRFNSINDILYAKIEPKCNVIPLVIEHFNDRLYIENWIIEDVTHNLFAVHKSFSETMIFSGDYSINNTFDNITNSSPLSLLSNGDRYKDLWKTFFDTIAIKERTNPRCQRNLMPIWMRTHMTEIS